MPRLLAQALHSQVDLHRDYGGVVPELASRDHIRRVLPLARQVLAEAECPLEALDVVAYTRGPGLAGALLVGAGIACSLAALARNTAMPARSSGLPQRPAGVRASTRSLRPGTCERAVAVRSVSIHPGSTALTWIPSFAQAVASDFVSCTMPPLLAQYAVA